MKGLFLKDYYLNFSNRRSLFLFLFMSIFMAFAMDGSFIIGYTGMLMGILAIGTISYDSNDNGMSFLMCLPVSRKDYVKEKFIYTFLMETIGCLIGLIIFFLASAVKGVPVDLISELSFGAGFALTMSLTLFLMTYIELKYGVEKSRTAMFVMYGIAFILVFAVKQIQGLQSGLIAFANILLRTPGIVLVIAILILYLLIVFVLYRLSLRAMEKKEF
jgi:hypothetical protein